SLTKMISQDSPTPLPTPARNARSRRSSSGMIASSLKIGSTSERTGPSINGLSIPGSAGVDLQVARREDAAIGGRDDRPGVGRDRPDQEVAEARRRLAPEAVPQVAAGPGARRVVRRLRH